MLIQSVATLFGVFPEPEQTLVGIMLIIASAFVMTAVHFQKMTIAKKIGSRALKGGGKGKTGL